LARLGGDEFALLLLRADLNAVKAAAQRVLEVLALPVSVGPAALAVAASIGIRVLEADDTASIAIRDADVAMQDAKLAGKACWRVFDAAMGERAERRVRLMADLPGAWRRREMQVHYQPIVELPTGRIRGAEALLRWVHPDFGNVSPGEFIVLAEETGVVRELGLEVLREATRNAALWRTGRATSFYISVNVSPVQLDDLLPDTIVGILAATGLDASALLIEITENVVLSNVEASVRVLEALRERGLRIAIDDFGTGYSSLAYVQRFPIDLVKIDQSFTRELDATHPGMIPTIIQLACTMDAAVVAEGVETREQMTELVRLGCTLCQGYLFSPGVPADAFAPMVRGGTLVPGGARSPNASVTRPAAAARA
jgi:predicted signal transduction protein with EAL and GGDEF domain